MTHDEIVMIRTQAIKFYGNDGFQQVLRVAEQYMKDQKIEIPKEGIQSMPSFWITIKHLMLDETK